MASKIQPIFILAPMDDVTDTVFRRIVASCAKPDLFFTEFVNVDGLQSPGREKLLPRLALIDEPYSVVAQIWGKNPDNFYKTTKDIIKMGFAGVDINFGCPIRNVVQNNTCSAMIKPENRDLAVEIIKAVQKGAAGKIPVSVKTRLGFDKVDNSWHELLLQQKLDMLSIHVRTVKEMSKVPAHWDELKAIVALRDKISPSTKIIINGDIPNYPKGLEVIKSTGADGAMIGRGIFADPYAFAKKSPWPEMTRNEKLSLFKKHIELFAKTWTHGERRFETIKKFVKIYTCGIEDASELRDKIMHCEGPDELFTLVSATIDADAAANSIG
mgnify:CR=1 FL=1